MIDPHARPFYNLDPIAGAPAPAPAPAPSPAPAPAPEGRTVDHDVYRRVVEAKQGLEAQVGAQKDQIAALSERAATADTLAAQVREWQGKAAEAEGKFGRFKAIASALGTTDDEAVEAAEWAHSRLPAEGRPSVGDWLTAIKAAPDTAPKVLAPWLTAPAAPVVVTGTTPAPAPAQPKVPTRGVQATGAPAAISGDAIRAARDKGVASGDWSDFQALKKAGGYRTVDKANGTR